MKKRIFGAVIVAACGSAANASDAPTPPPPKGTVCFANSLRNTEQVGIWCKALGKFSSIADIYERGYRVVSSGVLPEAGTGTVFFFIEERK
jgi:opacity protein-like surface antigen